MTRDPSTSAPTRGAIRGPDLPEGVVLRGPWRPECEQILTRAALEFVALLERRFRVRRADCLAARAERQRELDAGWRPDFGESTAGIRSGEWRVAPIPADLRKRHVEITGPVNRKMIVNALNSGADVFMADFEDSTSPTWANVIGGQQNLLDAVRRRIDFVHPESGKLYALADRTATLFVRPRGWHLDERHLLVDDAPVSASLFDFGLFFFHNAKCLIARGSGPYFYLPKLENHFEARLWNDVFVEAQQALRVPVGTIRATVLIETILAAFEMDEILFELRDHSAGLNCGRWDYIFSFIKRFRASPACVMPDRATIGMDRHFLRSYSQLVIRTCHRRGVHAIGGMAAQIPIQRDPLANEKALAKVRADKQREVDDGHDGTWVAHPGLVAVAREAFASLDGPHQIPRTREDVEVGAADLLAVPAGQITEAGLRHNLRVGVAYLEAWLRGQGCVPLDDLMEDAATAEISRAQLWQWVHHAAALSDDGRVIDASLVRALLDREIATLRASLGEAAFAASRFELARELFLGLVLADEFAEFLTTEAYAHI